jgi:hypothetical protein
MTKNDRQKKKIKKRKRKRNNKKKEPVAAEILWKKIYIYIF